MTSEIKKIISPDIWDFDSYWPADEESFSFMLSVIVGPKSELTEESFDIVVCTPKWFLDKYDVNEMILGRHKLIVFKFDMEKILSRIKRVFDGCSGNNWNEIALKLSRYGHWEFEDYQE